MSQIAETLTKQIAIAEALLQRVAAIPDGMPSPHLSGFIRYDEKYTRPLTREADGWETETREILRVLYGEESRQVADFLDCTRNKNHYFKFREELHDELESCIAFLKALIKAEDMKRQLAVEQPKNTNSKTPMVFISHSSKDKDFAEALVVLLEDLGMDSSNVFCSSVDGYGVGLSQDIFETLRSLFNEHELFVIFIHSPRYYDSPVSLNEMGAAWVLKTGFCSFLTTDMEFKDMTGVINQSKLSLKVDSEQAPAQLTEFKNILIQTFGLSNIDETKWARKSKDFFNKVLNISYTKVQKKGALPKVTLSEDEIDRLSKWVKSDVQVTYQMNYIGNRSEIYLGTEGYEVIGSEGKAEWEDFFERLMQLGLVGIKGYDKSGNPQYKLKKAAFDFIKNI